MTVYATAAELRAQIDKTTVTDDATLLNILTAVSDNIDKFCNRPDGFQAIAVASARTYSGHGEPWIWIDECISVSLVEVKDGPADTTYVTWASTDWNAFSGRPKSPNYNRTPYQGLMVSANGDYTVFTSGEYLGRKGFIPIEPELKYSVPTVRVTARWGYAATTPASIKEACIIQAARIYKRGQSAFADTIASADFGQLMYTRTLDPDVKQFLVNGRFVRPAVGA